VRGGLLHYPSDAVSLAIPLLCLFFFDFLLNDLFLSLILECAWHPRFVLPDIFLPTVFITLLGSLLVFESIHPDGYQSVFFVICYLESCDQPFLCL
jgi:hypothetical protein